MRDRLTNLKWPNQINKLDATLYSGLTKMTKRKCCSIGTLISVFHVFQFVFLITGITICAFATIHMYRSYHFMNILESSVYTFIVYLFLTIGCLVIVIFLLGCCALPKHKTLLLYIYILLLGVIFFTECVVGVLSYVYRENLEEEMLLNYNATILKVYRVDNKKTDYIDYVQLEFRCCGAEDFRDWQYSTWLQNRTVLHKVPDSCCKSPSLDCGFRDHPSNIYYKGCRRYITSQIQFDLWFVCAVSLGLSPVPVVGIILGVVLYLKLESKKYEEDNSINSLALLS